MSNNGQQPTVNCKLRLFNECPFAKIVNAAIARHDVNALCKICGLCLKAAYAAAHLRNEVKVVNTL